MLSKILEICSSSQQGVDLEEITRKLRKDPTVVEGMINHLLRMGELVEDSGQTYCEMCPRRTTCIRVESPTATFSIPIKPVQEYNPTCQDFRSSDQGSE